MKLITAGFKINTDNWKWSTKGYLCLVGLVNVNLKFVNFLKQFLLLLF